MPAKVIGKTLGFGFCGNPSRMSDSVIAPYAFVVADSTAGTKIEFGTPVTFDTALNGVRATKTGDTAADIVGFAVRHIGQPKEDNANGWYYQPGEVVDVMVRGSMTVHVEDTTGIAARGTVYVDVTTGKVYAATGSNRVALTNAKFATGKVDGEGIAEITLTERVI